MDMKCNFYKKIFTAAFLLLLAFNVSSQTAVSSFEELDAIRQNLQGSYYLTNDIEIPAGVNWLPIGAISAVDEEPAAFEGTLDGKGYKIKNLSLNYEAGKGKGLFGRLRHATIKDLGLENVNIKGTIQVGAIAGQFSGESLIERVWITGKIEGNDTAGGMIGGIPIDSEYSGYNTIKDCFVNIELIVNIFQGGGIVGQAGNKESKLSVENVYVAGTLNGLNLTSYNNNMGGILGYTNSTFIKIKSVAILCSKITGGTPNFVYSRAQYPEIAESIYVRDDVTLSYFSDENKGKGAEYDKMDIHFVQPAVFTTADFYKTTLGWDFENVWTINEGEYPVLINSGGSGIVSYKENANCNLYATTGTIHIDPTEPVEVNIHDLTGKLLHSEIIYSKTGVSMTPGLYIVKLCEGDKESVKKVLVD